MLMKYKNESMLNSFNVLGIATHFALLIWEQYLYMGRQAESLACILPSTPYTHMHTYPGIHMCL